MLYVGKTSIIGDSAHSSNLVAVADTSYKSSIYCQLLFPVMYVHTPYATIPLLGFTKFTWLHVEMS